MSTSKRIMPLRQRLIKAKHPEAIRLHSYIVLRPRYDDLGAVQAVAYIPMRRSLDSELYAKLLEEAAEVQYWHRMTPLELLIQRNNLVETLTEARSDLRSCSTQPFRMTMNNQNLGFVPYPRARVLYVGKRHGNVGWYEYDIDADEPIIPELPAVRGYLADVYAATFVRDGKPTDKLCVSLNIGDQLITIETGLNTVFAHHLLAALVDMPVPKDEGRPITIGVEPGDKVVFARVWDADDRRVMIPDDLEGVETRALLAEVRGRWFGVDESPPPPDAAEDEPVNDDEPENPYADKAERIHKRLLVVEDFDAAYRKAAEMIDEWPEAERQLGIRALEQAVLARRPQKPLTHEELLGEPQTTR